jgi:hypothetical protein
MRSFPEERSAARGLVLFAGVMLKEPLALIDDFLRDLRGEDID